MVERRLSADAVQRAGVFAELPAILVSGGVDPRNVLDALGTDTASLTYDSRIPLLTMLECYEKAAHALDCPHLGLIVGQRFSFKVHGVIGRLMMSAATLEEAILDFVTWQQGYSTGAVVYLNKISGGSAFGYGSFVRSHPGAFYLYDAVTAVACRMVADLTKGKVRPVEVLLSHRRPANVKPYLQYLSGKVRFDQPQSCVILDEVALSTPLPGRDLAVHNESLSELKALSSKLMPSLALQMAHKIKPLLHRGLPKIEFAARTMNLNSRTLRRHLLKEGTSFEKIRDQVRFAFACELLALTDLPIGEISSALAYATHGAFNAAFHRWAGVTPSAWRATQS
ncbi:MAG: AraC family transcriptional regulator ligand-binding domain-containing protein [Alsobacter sp.]